MRRFPSDGISRHLFLAAGFLISLCTPVSAQEMPVLAPEDLSTGRIVRTEAYPGRALYGYMNGGAELYHEYGFRRLVVQEVTSASFTFHLEVFTMGDAEGAAGIFSASRDSSLPDTLFGSFSTLSRFALQFARGPYFVRVANERGDAEAGREGRRLGSLILRRIPDGEFRPPHVFRSGLLRDSTHRLVLLRGPLGLQNAFEEWSDLFEGLEGFRLVVLPLELDSAQVRIATVEFDSTETAEEFHSRIKKVASDRHPVTQFERDANAFTLFQGGPDSTLSPYRDLLHKSP